MKILSDDFLSQYKSKIPPFGPIGYLVYKRTYSRFLELENRTEEWWETCAREINSIVELGCDLTKQEAEEFYDHCFNLKCSFSGRAKWQLGSPTVSKIGGASMNNCWGVSIDNWKAFVFAFDMLMLGGGVGYNLQREYVYQLPKIKKNITVSRKDTKDADYIVPDSREGWCELLSKTLESYFESGKSFTYSTICIRGKGAQIKGFGGTSSGPEDLVTGIEDICKILKSRENKKVRPIDCLDVMNIIGRIVVSGNVRRSAQIAIGDQDDRQFLNAKKWELNTTPNWRSNSNNSIVCNDISLLDESFWDSFKKDPKTGRAKGELYGLVNLKLLRNKGRVLDCHRTDKDIVVLNPCQPAFATVLTVHGIRQFSEINIGDLIWSGKTWTKIINKCSNGIKPVFDYRTSSGSFIGTENHRVLQNGEKIEVKNATGIDSSQGNYYFNSFGKEFLDPSHVMDGLVIGDGGVHRASNDLVLLYVGKNDKDYFDFTKSEVFGLMGKERSGISPYTWEVQTSITPNELPKTYKRKIPDRYYYGSPYQIRGFLKGIYSANGSICGNRVALKTSSFELLKQIQVMLSSIGIKSYYTTNKSKLNKFTNGEYLCKESYDLNISEHRERFYNSIGFIQNYKMDKLKGIIDEIKMSRCKNTFDIISKTYLGDHEVFDITVEDDKHTYWTGGVLVSNCGEIGLSSVPETGEGESCNLFELFVSRMENKDEFIKIAKYGYRIVKTIAALKYHWLNTNKLIHKNMRLGISISGICEWFPKMEIEDAANWLDSCYKELEEEDKRFSKLKGYNESIKLTTTKPSGTLSKLCNTSPGVHPFYSEYYIQRIRIASDDPLIPILKRNNYPMEFKEEFDGSLDRNTIVVSFPIKSPDESIVSGKMAAIDQLELVKFINTYWSDNSTSVTVYYREEELNDIRTWLKMNYNDFIKSLSFLMHSDHGFKQAPYEEISKEKYDTMIQKITPLTGISNDSGGWLMTNMECSEGMCPIV